MHPFGSRKKTRRGVLGKIVAGSLNDDLMWGYPLCLSRGEESEGKHLSQPEEEKF